MDLSAHNLAGLFAQLGLDNNKHTIEMFITEHKGLSDCTKLADASFWNQSQANFLTEAISQDSDWSEVVDVLDSMLR